MPEKKNIALGSTHAPVATFGLIQILGEWHIHRQDGFNMIITPQDVLTFIGISSKTRKLSFTMDHFILGRIVVHCHVSHIERDHPFNTTYKQDPDASNRRKEFLLGRTEVLRGQIKQIQHELHVLDDKDERTNRGN